MSDTSTDLEVPDLSGLGGLGAMLTEARAALATSKEPSAEVAAVAAQLAAVVDRLDIVATNLEMALEMFARLGVGWNALADNVDALAKVADKPLTRAGLALAAIPRV